MKPQLTLQTPLELPAHEIHDYLKKLWISRDELDSGANTFSLIVWQPSWLEQCFVRSKLTNGPITGYLTEEIIAAAKKLILENGLPLATPLHSRELIDLVTKNTFDESPEDLRGQFFETSISTLNPRRIITLAPTIKHKHDIKTFVSAYCPISDEIKNQTICGDLVVFRGSVESIFSKGLKIIEQLSIDDLPTWLWWNGSLDDSPDIFDYFSSKGKRLIIDTANGSYERCIDILTRALKSNRAINDLNWVRLKSWRETLAMIFDPPSRRNLLDHITQIDVDIEGDNIVQAIFLISWISDKLNWLLVETKKEKEITLIKFKRDNGETIFTYINPVPIGNPSIHSGQVIGLRLISKVSKDPKKNTCIILGSESAECMRLEAGGMADMHLIEEVVSSALMSSEADVSKLLASSRGDTSPLFENSINITSKIFNNLKY